MLLDFINKFQDVQYFVVDCFLRIKKDIAVRMCDIISIFNEFRVIANLAVVAADQFKKAEDAAFINFTETEGRRSV